MRDSINPKTRRAGRAAEEAGADRKAAASNRPRAAEAVATSQSAGAAPGTFTGKKIEGQENRKGNLLATASSCLDPFTVVKGHTGARASNAPACDSFETFLLDHARVLQRDGTGGKYSVEGRAPLSLVIEWIDKILKNTLHGETVEIDGVTFLPGELKGSSVAVGGGAQWGKTILELNLVAYGTAIQFVSIGVYLPDRPKLMEIVDQKFRPNVLDLYPWMSEMIQIGKTQNASGKTVDRKESFTVTDGVRKSFGNFCGMHKPPTSITLDVAVLDEVDDIPDRNIGYVNGRMTNSPIALTLFIGTQRVAGAGQNARVKASSYHVKHVPCARCKREWVLEEEFPRIIRIAKDGTPRRTDPSITPEMGHDRRAHYYCACPECGTELDRDAGEYRAKHADRVRMGKLGVRVSQLNCSAISMQEFVGAWYAALEDPSGAAITAFYCDRVAIPNAGAAQPITQEVLDSCRKLGISVSEEDPQPYAMSLSRPQPSTLNTQPLRFAGMDMGPRCWLWVDEVQNPFVSACVWAELISSGSAPSRLPLLMDALGISCVFLDAGGEPDLTKRLVMSLNGLESYSPPVIPRTELLKTHLNGIGAGLSWDGARGKWSGLRAAAVLFVAGEGKGVEQTIAFTQDGLIYPQIKCNRAESIQTAVNDFLTPSAGVLEMIDMAGSKTLRKLPRARLPETYIGAGATQAVLDGHLLNLRKEKNPQSGAEDWVEGVENHLGLSKVYARLAQMVAGNATPMNPGQFHVFQNRRTRALAARRERSLPG